jgi:hypothetical protein
VDPIRTRLLELALTLPETVEEHPWEETVATVRLVDGLGEERARLASP